MTERLSPMEHFVRPDSSKCIIYSQNNKYICFKLQGGKCWISLEEMLTIPLIT